MQHTQWLASATADGTPIAVGGSLVGLNVRTRNMTLDEGIRTWDPFQNPHGFSRGNTLAFRADTIGMLLRINGF